MSQGSHDGRLEAHCNRGTGTVLQTIKTSLEKQRVNAGGSKQDQNTDLKD